jgi:hypothetical protein
LLLCIPAAADAEEPNVFAAPSDSWEVSFSPYLWGTGVEGTIDARGNSANFDTEFSDILDLLNVGAMAMTEARKGRFVALLDLFYADLRDDSNVGPLGGDLDLEMTQFIGDARLGYTVYTGHLDLDLGPHTGDFAFDLLPGVRYWYLRTEVEVQGPLLGTRSVDESKDWVDAVLGGRLRLALSERVSLNLAADYGGFGWGSSSDPSWQFGGTVRFRASERWSLAVGWRALEIDRDQAEVTMDGAILGASYRF